MRLLLCLLFGTMALSISNAQNCQSAFSFGDTGITIDFFDESTANAGDPIVDWDWDFEEGTSNQQNPTFIFSEPGTYEVCLTITTQSGCTSTSCVDIETCVLQVGITLGDCDADGNIPLTINISDPFDAAGDINVSIDGNLVPGSPFRIRDDEPVTINTTVIGDGLEHLVTVNSEDVGTCTASVPFSVPDCSSDCFLSSMSISTQGGATHTVDVGDDFFAPNNLTITVGDIVDFVWVGDGHSTTSDATSGPDSWNSGVIGFGSSYEVSITNPGVHRYYCIPHGGPNGAGMAGVLVANCPAGGQFDLAINFTTSIANAAGYEVLIDGVVVQQNNYTETGPQSAVITVAGDGQEHTIEVRDINDPSCILSRTYLAPDCGAAPSCSLQATATESGPCNNNEVPVELVVMAINPGASGFNVAVNGVSAGNFNYDPSGTTTITINVPGNGQSQNISVQDIADSNCNTTTSITTTNCAIPCAITNLTAATGSATLHTVEVRDFDFFPQHITITAGDQVQWIWTGAVAHTSTSDATAGPDSWESGLLNNGDTYTSPVLSAGLHPYYCIPHGAPGGVGMAGTITVQADCTNGQVSANVSFSAQGGGFNGYQVLVDGQLAASGAYDPSGQNSIAVLIPGDGLSHDIVVQDVDDPACTASTSITTPDCNAPTCSLSLSAEENGPCDASDQVSVLLTVNDVGGSNAGFSVSVDGSPAGTFNYSGSGTTTVSVDVAGDGQLHTITVEDLDSPDCNATAEITTTNCIIPCSIFNLEASSGSATLHTVEVRDFDFFPQHITITAGDQVEWIWTGAVAHTSTSDATAGPDSWESGLLNNGDTYTSPVLSAGLHPYYCIPHGAPGGVGMAGTITVQADCTNGQVSANVSFSAQGGGFNGYQVLVDGQLAASGAYDPSGQNSIAVLIPGDGLSHDIVVQDVDDPACTASTSITTPDCNAPTCSLSLSAEENGPCDASDQVSVLLTVNDVGGSNAGFSVSVDGSPAGTFNYSGSGTTTVSVDVAGDGQLHTITVQDLDSPDCNATAEITTSDCSINCELSDLTLTVAGQGNGIVHVVEVQDFEFVPATLDVTLGDTVRFIWTGVIPHTATSDAESGPDSWDSGLIGQGSVYDVVLTSLGTHPYYCIPHGAPGGIGMAGSLQVNPPCENGQASVEVNFTANGPGSAYQIWVDGMLYPGSPYNYASTPEQQQLIELNGDGQSHAVQVRDLDDPACFVNGIVSLPDCSTTNPACNLNVSVDDVGSCDDDGQVEVALNILHQGNGSGFHILLDGTQITTSPISYSTAGSTDTSILLTGTGSTRTITVADADSTNCSAMVEVLLPECATDCFITDLAVQSGPGLHIVNVEDFRFSPEQVNVNVGDTVRFVWTGAVAHTTTSDATSGMDSWNSGLLDQGATYDLILNEEGEHPYYCIPHGGPGGIGMAGNITARQTCNNGQGLVNVSFNVSDGSALGYQVFVDGEFVAGPLPYDNPMGANNVSIEVSGDASTHVLTIQDLEIDFCAASTVFEAPDCPEICLIEQLAVATGPQIVHTIAVEDFVFEPSYLQARVGETIRFVWTGEIPHTATTDATSGPDVWDSGLLGQGEVFEVTLTEAGLHPYYCIPHGGPGGIGMAGVIEALPSCEDSLAQFELSFDVTNGSSSGYRVFINGTPWQGNPVSYDDPTGSNQLSLLYPAFGQSLSFTVQDMETPFCAATATLTAPDCSPQCELNAFTLGEWNCVDDEASIQVAVVNSNGSEAGFLVTVDGSLLFPDPLPYQGDTSWFTLTLPNDGFAHQVELTDALETSCNTTLTLTALCPGACGFSITEINIAQRRRHEVLVRDFDFLPLELEIAVGDTVHFVWTGNIPHTATSDSPEGPDAFNSGLLGNGAEFEVVFQTAGPHPYYCVPHGAPGGIGMAGLITALEDCDDGELDVAVRFDAMFPEGTAYQVLVDEVLHGNSTYAPDNPQTYALSLPADGNSYLLSIIDESDMQCRLDTLIAMPDCSDPCFDLTAAFTYEMDGGAFSYRFTDQSGAAVDSRVWDFGDGTGSTDSIVNLTFPGPGLYEVCLVVTDDDVPCTDTICQVIELADNLCDADFSYEIDGLTVHFTDESNTSAPITDRLWQFPNDIQITGQEMPSFTFPAGEVVEICLTITTDQCQDTHCETIDLSDPCLTFEANFSIQQGEGLTVQLIDQSSGNVNQWLWGFGDGSTTDVPFPTHTYPEAGLYRICLLVQDTINGCNDVFCIDQYIGTTAVSTPVSAQELRVFPNPAGPETSQWILEGWLVADWGSEQTIKIHDFSGRQILQQEVQIAEQVRLPIPRQLPAGLYLLEVQGQEVYYLAKILKQ